MISFLEYVCLSVCLSHCCFDSDFSDVPYFKNLCLLSATRVFSANGNPSGLLAMYIWRALGIPYLSRIGSLSTTSEVDWAARLYSGVSHNAAWKKNFTTILLSAWNTLDNATDLRAFLEMHIDTSRCDEFFKNIGPSLFPMRLL